MRRFAAILFLLGFLFIGGKSVRAQYYSWGADAAALRWKHLRTEDVRVVFPDTASALAHRTLYYIQAVRPTITHGFSHPPLKIPFVLFKAVREQKRFLREIHPDVVFSKGGFISLPTMLAARKLKIPCVAHESDLSLGLANRIAGKKGATILTGFDKTATLSDDFIYVGFPLRKEVEFGNASAAVKKYGLDKTRKTLLVIGGSMGAKKLNDVLAQSLDVLLKDYEIVHVTGKGKNEISEKQGYHPVEFTNDIGDLFAAADLVVSRAGAGAICELTYLKKPLLLIPLSKSASRGDQLDNAEYARNFGARVLYEESLSEESFINEIYRTTVPTRPVSCAGNRTIARILTSFAKGGK